MPYFSLWDLLLLSLCKVTMKTIRLNPQRCVLLCLSELCWRVWGVKRGGVLGLVGKVEGIWAMIAASKRGLHGFPVSSCTCHYGITDATSTFFTLLCDDGKALRIPEHTCELKASTGRGPMVVSVSTSTVFSAEASCIS